ncbi:hypothetical protein [Persicitalea sp.]|uniref:hypothetical protein n=1 Tax=Persicitalea sp. TaxID=3100273 RepID=UPI0035937EA7
MKKEITRIDVGSAALMSGAVMALLSLVFIFFFFLIFSLPFANTSLGGYERGLIFGGGAIMLIFVPIIYGVIGIASGALSAVIYNFIAGRIGGVKVYVKD